MDSMGQMLATVVLTAVALADIPTAAPVPIPLCVVIQNHAGVHREVLSHAIQTVTAVYWPLGIGVVWIEGPFQSPRMTTVHLSILSRNTGHEGARRGAAILTPEEVQAILEGTAAHK